MLVTTCKHSHLIGWCLLHRAVSLGNSHYAGTTRLDVSLSSSRDPQHVEMVSWADFLMTSSKLLCELVSRTRHEEVGVMWVDHISVSITVSVCMRNAKCEVDLFYNYCLTWISTYLSILQTTGSVWCCGMLRTIPGIIFRLAGYLISLSRKVP